VPSLLKTTIEQFRSKPPSTRSMITRTRPPSIFCGTITIPFQGHDQRRAGRLARRWQFCSKATIAANRSLTRYGESFAPDYPRFSTNYSRSARYCQNSRITGLHNPIIPIMGNSAKNSGNSREVQAQLRRRRPAGDLRRAVNRPRIAAMQRGRLLVSVLPRPAKNLRS
jgi:hypothetical protein